MSERGVLFSCRQATRLVSDSLERPLPLRRRLALTLHLALCSACRAYRRQVIGIDRLLRLPREPQDGLSDAERTRLLARLRGNGPPGPDEGPGPAL